MIFFPWNFYLSDKQRKKITISTIGLKNVLWTQNKFTIFVDNHGFDEILLLYGF